MIYYKIEESELRQLLEDSIHYSLGDDYTDSVEEEIKEALSYYEKV